jgi:hypothetical protein
MFGAPYAVAAKEPTLRIRNRRERQKRARMDSNERLPVT